MDVWNKRKDIIFKPIKLIHTMIDANKLMNFLLHDGASETYDSVNKLLREIIILDRKFKHPEEQSFYFRQGIDSNTKRYNQLKKYYENIKHIINTNDLDYFIAELNDSEMKKKKFREKSYMNFINRLHLSFIQNEIENFKDLIYCKNKYGQLKEIEEILQDEFYINQIFKAENK